VRRGRHRVKRGRVTREGAMGATGRGGAVACMYVYTVGWVVGMSQGTRVWWCHPVCHSYAHPDRTTLHVLTLLR